MMSFLFDISSPFIAIGLGFIMASTTGYMIWYLVKQITKSISLFTEFSSFFTALLLCCVLRFIFASYPETYIYFFDFFRMGDALKNRLGGLFIAVVAEFYVYALVLFAFAFLLGANPDKEKEEEKRTNDRNRLKGYRYAQNGNRIVSCPYCGSSMEAWDQIQGLRGECPRCKQQSNH